MTIFMVQACREKLLRDAQESLLCLAGDDEANDISDFGDGQTGVVPD